MTTQSLKAYTVTWSSIPQMPVIFLATTAGKATYLAYLSARNLQRTAQLTDFATRRAPRYDAMIEGRHRPGPLATWDSQPFRNDDGTGRAIQ